MKFTEFKLTNLAVDNKTTIYIFTIIMIIFGMMQYNATPKEENPEIVFPYFMIATIYPGTSPADIENLVTRPIEKELKGIDGVKDFTSNSIQDFSSIFVEFELNADETQAYLDVKQAIDDARSELPSDLLSDPTISRIDLSEIPIVFINLSGDLSLVKLKEYADDLQDEIEALEEITRADIIGALDREIQINVDLYKMQAAGLSFQSIQGAIAAENMTISGGQIDIAGMRKNLRVIGEFRRVEQIKNILLQEGIYLKDIAEIVDGFKDRESYARLNGQDVITLAVIKKGGKNLIYAVDKIKVILDNFRKETSENLIIKMTGDSSTKTRNAVGDLFNTIILGFVVVVFVLMFFMGQADALFVGIAIPLSMLIAFIFIPVVGFTLNRVVLMAFILVLGIVVDNSIVVIENIYRHFTTTENLPIIPATKRGVGEVAMSVFTGTLTTMAPFFPLIFMPGIAGKFISFLPVTILITLSASMLVAYTMNPVFAVSFMKYKGEKKIINNHKKIMTISVVSIVFAVIFYIARVKLLGNLIVLGLTGYLLLKYVIVYLIDKFQRYALPALKNSYKMVLAFLLKGKRPYGVIVSTVFLFIFTFILLGIKTPSIVFFPSGDPNNLYVYITMPEGTHIAVTDSITKVVEEKVFNVIGRDNPDVESIVSNVASNAGSSLFERSTQDKLAKITISFVEYKFRSGEKSTKDYLDDLREHIRGIAGAEIEVDREASGPPTGKPINIEVSGKEINELIALTNRLKDYINSLNINGIEDLQPEIEVSKPEIVLNIDRDKANQLGISTAYVGMTLRTALYGTEVSKFKEGEEEYPIQLRLDKKYRNDIDVLLSQEMTAPSSDGGPPGKVPISTIARIDQQTTYGGITRIDNERVIILSSNVLSGYNANEIVRKIRNTLPNFEVPDGYQINFTGEQDLQAEIAAYLQFALFIAMGMIFIILVAQFNSLAKPVIIITQIFLSFIGVLLGFIIFDLEISVIMTGMGIIAVAGIVVKNAIIIVDYTGILIGRGNPKIEAIIQAGVTRLTPVILTALSTILGLMPLAIGMNLNFITLFTDLQPNIYFGGDNAAFWNPLAWTIIFGLTFATFLTLIVVPVMYRISFARKERF